MRAKNFSKTWVFGDGPKTLTPFRKTIVTRKQFLDSIAVAFMM